MNAKTQVLVGILATALLGVSGGLLLAEHHTVLGIVLLALAALRAVVAVQQIRALREV